MSTYYELLGVPQSASEIEIRSAYGRDVLHLQNETSDKVAQFRAVLDAAFATLVDPVKRSAYDEALAVAVQSGAAASSDESDAAFKYAMRGGLWFAGGGLVTAGVYPVLPGADLFGPGALLFGGFHPLRGPLRNTTRARGARAMR